jgi:hypothetical protein
MLYVGIIHSCEKFQVVKHCLFYEHIKRNKHCIFLSRIRKLIQLLGVNYVYWLLIVVTTANLCCLLDLIKTVMITDLFFLITFKLVCIFVFTQMNDIITKGHVVLCCE